MKVARFAALSVIQCAMTLSHAETYDAANDFSISANGPLWSYGSQSQPGSAFTPFTAHDGVERYSLRGLPDSLRGWNGTEAPVAGLGAAYPMIVKNMSTGMWRQEHNTGPDDFIEIAPLSVMMHASPNALATIRFTIPSSGIYSIEAHFFREQHSTRLLEQVVSVYVDSAPVFSQHIVGNGAKLIYTSSDLSLNAGDTIDFCVASDPTHPFDGTGGFTGGTMGTTARVFLKHTISGHVILQNYSPSVAGRPVNVEIRPPGSQNPAETHIVRLDAQGDFSFTTPLQVGPYDIAAKASHWLRRTLTNQSLTSSGLSGLSFSLVNGDINGDNAVTLADFARLRAAFGSSSGDPNWDPESDLNGDGAVTLGDFAILRSNFGTQGDP